MEENMSDMNFCKCYKVTLTTRIKIVVVGVVDNTRQVNNTRL